MNIHTEQRFDILCADGTTYSKPYPWYLRWLLHWLQSLCMHHAMKADLLEGCSENSVRWCETCGAVWLCIDGTPMGGGPRMPEPTWERKYP